MKVLFQYSENNWDIFYSIQLELIKNHILNNDEVFILDCNSGTKCLCKYILPKKSCLLCKTTKKMQLSMIGGSKITKLHLKYKQETGSELKIDSIEQLKGLKADNYDIGMSIASLLISMKRDPKLNITSQIKFDINNFYNEEIVYKNALLKLFGRKEFDRIYIFNGRYPHNKMTLRVAQAMNIEVYVYEKSEVMNKFVLYKNTYPHDITFVKRIIEEHWSKNDDLNSKERIVKSYYNNRILGKHPVVDFTKDQEKDYPLPLDKNKINIGIFISSEDEYESIPEWGKGVYNNQNEAIQMLIDYENWNQNIHFIIRVHPNLNYVDNYQTKYLNQIDNKLMTVISAGSKVSTYRLMEAVDIVLTYGSTVGIEACLKKIPSILCGRSMYEDLDGIVKPSSHEELCKIITQFAAGDKMWFDLEKGYLAALKYGWYLATYGEEFRHFKQLDRYDIKYIGKGKLLLRTIFNSKSVIRKILKKY